MLWWFEREGAVARCQVLDLPHGGYELRIAQPDGTETIEHFTNAADLAKRQQAVNEEFKANGWAGPHGWRI